MAEQLGREALGYREAAEIDLRRRILAKLVEPHVRLGARRRQLELETIPLLPLELEVQLTGRGASVLDCAGAADGTSAKAL
jgi:hypothetical protein